MSAVVADAQGSASEAGGACTPGTKGCICGTLAVWYERGELDLWAGRVDRSALARKLGATRCSRLSTQAGRRSKAPGRCIVRFDRRLKEQGHGRRWAERLPAIRAYLERRKESGTLPMSRRRRLNRSAVLREFAPDMKSYLSIVHANPAVKALLDEYDDVIRDDERYSPYKYDALEGELKELLDREFEPAQKGKINKCALARRLGVPPAALSWTPKLDALIREKQAEVDEVQRRGVAGGVLRARRQGVHLRDALGFVRARRTCPAGRKGAAKCVGSQARCNEVVDQPHCSRATLEGAWPVRRAFRPCVEGAGPWKVVGRAPSGNPRVLGAVQGIGHLADVRSWEVEPSCGAARVRTSQNVRFEHSP